MNTHGRKITRVTPGKPYRTINLMTLKVGDLFIIEDNDQIISDFRTGKFVHKALSKPKRLPPPELAVVKIQFVY